MEPSAVVGIVMGILIGLAILAIFTVIFRWLWNTTMPDVFGVKSLTFWQALKILILAGILFGGHRAVVDTPQDVAKESPTVTDVTGSRHRPPSPAISTAMAGWWTAPTSCT
jgi:hypothetical protein